MELVTNLLSAGAIPLAIFIIIATFVALVVTWAKNYHTVPPNKVAVISGKKRKAGDGTLGYRVVSGGGFWKMPIVERVDYLDLNVMSFGLEVVNVPAANGALVTVRAIANVKVKSDAASVGLAIERFLGLKDEQIEAIAKENLESNLRAIVGALTIEKLISERGDLQEQVIREAKKDLAILGLEVDLLNIQDVRDDRGYIDALGATRTAEVKRDAAIGKAKAERDALMQASEAMREGQTKQAEAQQAISDAERQRDVVKADNAAKVAAASARVPIVQQIAAQEEQARLNVVTVEAQKAKTTAETELQALELKRRDAELKATTIIQAERDREAQLIGADAEQKAAALEGEAERIRQEKAGQGVRARQEQEAQGRIALADAIQREAEAAAEGERARLLAAADGERAALEAKAAGTLAMQLAEAEGALKKAEAFKALDEAGRFLMILDASPNAIRAIGDAVREATRPTAVAVGEGLGNIEHIKIIDMGNRTDGKGPLEHFAHFPIETIAKMAEQASAAGLGDAVKALAGRCGVTLPPNPPSDAV